MLNCDGSSANKVSPAGKKVKTRGKGGSNDGLVWLVRTLINGRFGGGSVVA